MEADDETNAESAGALETPPLDRSRAADPEVEFKATGLSTAGRELIRRRRRWTLWALVAWTLAVAGAGLNGGWFMASQLRPNTPPAELEIVEVPAVETLSELRMPDVRGLTSVDAKQALVDSGIDAAHVKTRQVQWAGEADLVISQVPVPGEDVEDGVLFDVSAATTMPNVVGMTQTEAIASLGKLGVVPEIVEAFKLTSRTGTVLMSTPKAGESLPETVELTVAQAGASVFLSTLDQEQGDCSTDQARIDGSGYAQSLECSSGEEEPAEGLWLLDRRAKVVTGIVGVDDRADETATATVRFRGDNNKELGVFEVAYAKPKQVTLVVDDMLRLEIEVSSPNGDSVVLADFLVKGTPTDITALETR